MRGLAAHAPTISQLAPASDQLAAGGLRHREEVEPGAIGQLGEQEVGDLQGPKTQVLSEILVPDAPRQLKVD